MNLWLFLSECFVSGLLIRASVYIVFLKAWPRAHNFHYYLWQVRVNACTAAHVQQQRGPGESAPCPLLQFLHSILPRPRYNYSTSLPTCSSPCRSVRRPPRVPRHPHMQIRRPPSFRQRRTVLPCLGGEGTWSLPSALCPPPPHRTRLPPQYAGCDRGVRFTQGRRPARPTNLWIFSFPTPDEVFQLPTDSVFVLCLCFTPVEVNAAPDPAFPSLPTSRPLSVVDEMLSGTKCLSTTNTIVSLTCWV